MLIVTPFKMYAIDINISNHICSYFKFKTPYFFLLPKCVLQIAEYGFHWVLDNFGTRLNNTLEEIPILNSLKHMLQLKMLPLKKLRMKGKQNKVLKTNEIYEMIYLY